jgi:Ca2+-binding RTX toxin-like protein
MQMQLLERRRLCSVTVNETFPGFYEIVGDHESDVIVINVDQDAETFTLDGTTYTGVSYLSIYGNGGADTVDVHASHPGAIGASIDGGDGDDDLGLNFDGGIWAGGGGDTLRLSDAFYGEVYGDDGDDRVFVSGECVDPNIHGGCGDDLIDASANAYGVAIRGGDGEDTIYGSDYDDQIYGDGGADLIDGRGGNDTFFCRGDGAADHITGGAGVDFLYSDALDTHAGDVECPFYE